MNGHKSFKKVMESDRVVIFFRKEGFYPVQFTPNCKVEDHVRLNPGTIRVEELNGKIIWPTSPQVLQ